MAKRSDFAQKLLDDLRLRKEKLGYITSSGQQSAQPPYPGMLTSSPIQDEYLLRQLLINNQHFLNTVQAFFKVKIPICVLQDDKRDYPKEERKLLLDCGCELVRRKGKREVIHAMERPYALGKVRHLNALVKELNNDIESLKFPNVTVLTDDTAEFLHMMLERDIQNTKPAVNCMWDIGWSNSIFGSLEKNEVIRDLEIQVLGGLISELARELVDET